MNARPNILLVVFDSLSAHDMQLHLKGLPTLRALFSKSTMFTNVYTCCPESSPARASLMTGLDIAVHRLWTDGVALPDRETTLPEVFATHGYRTWSVGRRHLAGVSHWTTEHARRGEFHHFDWAHGPLHLSRQNAYLTWLKHKAPDHYATNFPRQANPDDTAIPPEQRQAMMALPDALSFNAWVGEQARARMGEAVFFGVLGFVVGETMGATGAPVERLDLRALKQADQALETLLSELPEDTVIALTAGRGSVEATNAASVLQEAAIKVPLCLALPDGTANTVEQIVSTMDIAPTLYALANIHPPQRVQGQSLISNAPRGWALSRMRNPSGPHQTAFRAANWKLIVTHEASIAPLLYDLAADPTEAQDLAGSPDHQARLENMLDLMIDARVALEDRLEPRIAKF